MASSEESITAIRTACGETAFDSTEEAQTCKVKAENATKKPHRYDYFNTGGSEFSPPDTGYRVSAFETCASEAVFSSLTTQSNRLDAKICAESLSRLTGQAYVFQVVPDYWAGTWDSYTVVLASDYTGPNATSSFKTREAAQDAVDALVLQTGKSYVVVNTGNGYILEEKK